MKPRSIAWPDSSRRSSPGAIDALHSGTEGRRLPVPSHEVGAAPLIEVDGEIVRAGWIGPAPTWPQIVAAMIVGVIGVVVCGLQPLLLGNLEAAGRITDAQLGHAAMAELLALGVGVGVGEAFLGGRPLRSVVILAALAYATANLSTLAASGEMVTLSRGLAGVPGGVMIWVITGLIVRSPFPARWSGAYLGLQTAVQLAIASALAFLTPERTDTAPIVMAGLGVVVVAAAFGLPRLYYPLPREEAASGLPPPRGWAVLGACVLVMACIVGAWVYIEPLGEQAKLPADVIAMATPISLGCQVLGAVCATLAAARLPWFAAIVGAGTVLVLATVALSTLPGAGVFLALQAVFGFAWLFILPFGAPLAIEADPTRRTALLAPAANLLGSALGPLSASLLVGSSDARSALHLCAGFALAALLLIVGLHLTRRRALSIA